MAIARSPYEADLVQQVRHIVSDAQENHRRQSDLLASEMRLLKQRVEHLSGFMNWVMHAYPDTIVQYNALMELQRTSNQESECEAVESGP